jgi:hypothetical protein
MQTLSNPSNYYAYISANYNYAQAFSIKARGAGNEYTLMDWGDGVGLEFNGGATQNIKFSSHNLSSIGTIQNGSVWINDGTANNNYNENIRLFNAPNGVSVIAFSATGTGGVPTSSILGYSDRFETRLGATWRTRVYSSGLYVNGGYYVDTTNVIDSSRNLNNIGTISSGAITSSSNFTMTGGFSVYLGNTSRFSSDNNGGFGINYGTTGGTTNASLSIYNNTTPTIQLNRDGTISSGAITSTGIINTNHIKDNGSSSGLRLGNFSTSNLDETGSSVVTFLRAGTFDDYIIKGSTSRGVLGRQFIGPHFSENHSWGVFSSGWDTHFQISGDDRIYMKPNVAIGATPSTTGPALDVYQTADRPSMTIRSSNPGSWAASLIVGNTTADQTLVDANDRPMVVIDGKYPVLNLNHTVTTNDNHGPTIQFTHEGHNSSRQWVIGTDGQGQRLDFGVSGGTAGVSTDKNPHNGISGYQGVTIMRLFQSGVLIGDTGVYPNEITAPDEKLDVRGNFSHTGGNLLRKTYNKAIGLYANGSASSGSAIGFQQITSEGWAGIYVDYNPYEGWGLYHDNPSNYFYITAEATTGSLGTSFTVPNRDSGSSTAYAKIRFDQNNGNIDAGGAITAQGNITAYSSDRRLKENFKPIESALDKVKQLNGLYFDWNKVSENAGFIPDQKQNDVGLIAQDVQQILPQAVAPAPFDTDVITTPKDPKDKNAGVTQETVSISGEDYLTVKYEKLVPLLVEAIKEQQKDIDKLKQEVTSLSSKI